MKSDPPQEAFFRRLAFFRAAFLGAAFLRLAFLRVAFLRVAFLRVAFLRVAFLRVAFLRVAFLRVAFLRVAFLRVAFLRAAIIGTPPYWWLLPLSEPATGDLKAMCLLTASIRGSRATVANEANSVFLPPSRENCKKNNIMKDQAAGDSSVSLRSADPNPRGSDHARTRTARSEPLASKFEWAGEAGNLKPRSQTAMRRHRRPYWRTGAIGGRSSELENAG